MMLPETERALKVLNDSLKLDPVGVSALMQSAFPINNDLLYSDLPLVVREDGRLGPIGLINGILNDPTTRIAAVVDDKSPNSCIIQIFIPVPRNLWREESPMKVAV
jgi:hypothetical protein